MKREASYARLRLKRNRCFAGGGESAVNEPRRRGLGDVGKKRPFRAGKSEKSKNAPRENKSGNDRGNTTNETNGKALGPLGTPRRA